MSESLTALYLQNPQLAMALRRRAYADSLAREGMSSEPVRSPWQGLARLANAGIAALLMGRSADELENAATEQKRQMADWNTTVQNLMGSGQSRIPVPQQSMIQPQTFTGARSMPYGDLIASSASAANIPPALLAQYIQTESGGNPNARNPNSTAAGIAQILESTATNPGYGMEPLRPNDRMNPTKAIPWMAQYIGARGKAAGIDWSNPQQVAGLMQQIGDGTPAYGARMAQATTGATPQGENVLSGMEPDLQRAQQLQAMAIAAANHPNPQIRGQASLLSNMATQLQTQALARLKFAEGAQPMSPERFHQQLEVAKAGATRVTQENKAYGEGAGEIYKLTAQNMNQAIQNDQLNKQAEQQLQMFETAAQAFRPGASAELRAAAAKTLAELGFDTNAPAANVMQRIQSQMKLAVAATLMRGQGQVSDRERELVSAASDLIGLQPDALPVIIQAMRDIHAYQGKIADIYVDSAERNGGAPNPVETAKALRNLAPPISNSLRNKLESIVAPFRKDLPSQQESPTISPSRAEIEAEMRRRGMIQ